MAILKAVGYVLLIYGSQVNASLWDSLVTPPQKDSIEEVNNWLYNRPITMVGHS